VDGGWGKNLVESQRRMSSVLFWNLLAYTDFLSIACAVWLNGPLACQSEVMSFGTVKSPAVTDAIHAAKLTSSPNRTTCGLPCR